MKFCPPRGTLQNLQNQFDAMPYPTGDNRDTLTWRRWRPFQGGETGTVMTKREADDPEFEALRMRHKADIEASGMTREELIDLLARNLALYNLLCQSYENNCRQLEGVIEIRTQLCELLEQQSAEHERKLLAIVNALPKVINESLRDGHKVFAAKAGRKGAAKRHAPTHQLKVWIIQEAEKIKGSHKGIARELAKRIPSELAEASSDPERLIYDTLRATSKNSAPKAAKGFVPFTRGR
jgi:hypothetical protein